MSSLWPLNRIMKSKMDQIQGGNIRDWGFG